MLAIRKQIHLLNPTALVEIVPFDGSFMRAALAFRPNVIQMFPMGSRGISRLLYLLKLYFRCRIVCFRAEGVINPTSLQNHADHVGYDEYGIHLIDAEIFWGPGAAGIIGEGLIKQGKISSSDRIKYYGYPRLESYFNESYEPPESLDAIPVKFSSFDVAHTVLIVTGFHFANYERETIVSAGDLDVANRLDDLLVLSRKVKEFRAQWICSVLSSARSNRSVLFVLKKHPIERTEDYSELADEPNVVLISQDVPIHDLIKRSSILVHYGSTIAADAYLAKIPTIYAYSVDHSVRDYMSNMGWPASVSIPIGDLELAIRKFVAKELSGEISESMQRVLEWNFNIKPGVEYTPSKDIAAFLLAADKGQSIPIWDRYMWRSLFWYAGVKIRQLYGRVVRHICFKAAW